MIQYLFILNQQLLNILFGSGLIFGKFLSKEPMLKKIFGKSIKLKDEGWDILSKRWIFFSSVWQF